MIAKHSAHADVLYRNVGETDWKFPVNVALLMDGKLVEQEDVYHKNTLVKTFYFLRFSFKMLVRLWGKKYDLVVLFDPLSLLAFNCVYRFAPKRFIVWYHNYDTIDLKNTRKYSLGWFAHKASWKMFPRIDFFSLPMEERVKLFPVHLLRNKYIILPNYSMIEFHAAKENRIEGDYVMLIYAGSIGEGHGLEEIIPLLKNPVESKTLQLTVKGSIEEEYKNKLFTIAAENNVSGQLFISPRGPWKEVPSTLRNAHVGIAIYTGNDQMNSTLGKGGSGKIFQYIAEGLPVLMNNSFYEPFRDCHWIVPTSLNSVALKESIGKIIRNYAELSRLAIQDFLQHYNCNIYFDQFLTSVAENKLRIQ